MNITQKARTLYNRLENFESLGCREQSDMLVTLRNLQLEIDPANHNHYDAQMYLDAVAMRMGVFIGPNGEIEVVGT